MGEGLTKSGQLYPQNQALRLGKADTAVGHLGGGSQLPGVWRKATVSPAKDPAQPGPANSCHRPRGQLSSSGSVWREPPLRPVWELASHGLHTQAFHPAGVPWLSLPA